MILTIINTHTLISDIHASSVDITIDRTVAFCSYCVVMFWPNNYVLCLSVQQHVWQWRVHVSEQTMCPQELCVWPWQWLWWRLRWVHGVWWVDHSLSQCFSNSMNSLCMWRNLVEDPHMKLFCCAFTMFFFPKKIAGLQAHNLSHWDAFFPCRSAIFN